MWFWGGITQLNVVVQSSYHCWCGQARSLKHKCHLASFMGEQLCPPCKPPDVTTVELPAVVPLVTPLISLPLVYIKALILVSNSFVISNS